MDCELDESGFDCYHFQDAGLICPGTRNVTSIALASLKEWNCFESSDACVPYMDNYGTCNRHLVVKCDHVDMHVHAHTCTHTQFVKEKCTYNCKCLFNGKHGLRYKLRHTCTLSTCSAVKVHL